MKLRLRDLGIGIGSCPPGPSNAITDVPGVRVGQSTLIEDAPHVARTGVTAIFPRADVRRDFVFAGFHSFNGIGEMTGLPFIEETGLLTSPVMLTNTHQVGLVYDTLVRYGERAYGGFTYKLPVVGETYDGWLNEAGAFPLRAEHIVAALESASGGSVAEGSSGGGTGMMCYGFKGGTGTASRRVPAPEGTYTVGALVQANHGNREHLLVDGAPVGREIGPEEVPLPLHNPPASSSILIVIATDAPLLPNQCKRLAQRGTIGLARTGGFGLNGSGDLFLAFSTGIHYDPAAQGPMTLQVLPQFELDDLVIATVEAVEEAILNALVAAETMIGYLGHTAHVLPHGRLLEVLAKYGRGKSQTGPAVAAGPVSRPG